MTNVFVSHSSADRAFVRDTLLPKLKASGTQPWFSEERIEPADVWAKAIVDGLRACDWFLVVMSPHAVCSRWVQSEVHWAMHERPNRVVPIMLTTCDPVDIHLLLGTIQYVDFRADFDEAARKLFKRLEAKVTTGAPSQQVKSGGSLLSRIRAAARDVVTVFSVADPDNGEQAFLNLRYSRPNEFCATKIEAKKWRIHRLNCSSFAFGLRYKLTASPKVCAPTDSQLREWARRLGVDVTECTRCHTKPSASGQIADNG